VCKAWLSELGVARSPTVTLYTFNLCGIFQYVWSKLFLVTRYIFPRSRTRATWHRMLEVLLSSGQIELWVSVKSSAPVWRLILKFSWFIKLSLGFLNLFIMVFVFLRLPQRWVLIVTEFVDNENCLLIFSLVSVMWKREKINPLDKLFVNSIVSEVLKLNSSKAADLSCAGDRLSHTFQFN